MAKKVKKAKLVPANKQFKNDLDAIRSQIVQYRDAAIAESWKGGGDPTDVPTIEINLKLQETVLLSLFEKLQRDYGDYV